MNSSLFISIIIPVHNGAQYLEKCLSSIALSNYRSYETIVVDDGSTDNSAEIARKYGAKVLELSNQSGPAAARNFGSKEAQGDILFFVDSDIMMQRGTVAQVVKDFDEKPDIAAVFGSYDDSPEEKNFSSQYMNLRHHFIHQISSPDAVTFWAGCGAIRKEIFHSIDGFDEKKYSRPCIEDIELGFRLKKMGYRILLDKELQVKHLKKWTLRNLISTDIFSRAIPWTKLILESREMVRDLNLQNSQKISTGLLGIIIILIPLSLVIPELLYLIPLPLAFIIVINRKLFQFFLKRKGLQFTLGAFAMYLLYYLYSGTSYVSCWLLYKIRT